MPNFACNCHKNMPDSKSRYTVDVLDRIATLFPESVITENTEFTYSFRGGYEKLDVHEYGHGSLSYAGAYHPDGLCETNTPNGEGICEYCGTVWH